MEGVWYRRMLLSIPSLFASSTDSTAAAAVLVGGRKIGDVKGERVVGKDWIGPDVGALVGDCVGLSVATFVTPVVGATVVPEDVVCAVDVACVVVSPPTSV